MVNYHHGVERADFNAVLDQILELAVLINEDMAGSLEQRGLTPARTHLLWEVSRRGPSTQRDLAEALRVSARNVTGLVDGLEGTGFVTRAAHPRDRRATLVTLTEQGEREMRRMHKEHRQFAHALFADMPDQQRAALSAGLTHVLERLRALTNQGASQ
jgi:DNA-binding MarR family transcriptional regulator